LASLVNCFSDLKNPQKQNKCISDDYLAEIGQLMESFFPPGFVVNYKLMKRGDKKFDIKIF
jgi:hypothetical protein